MEEKTAVWGGRRAPRTRNEIGASTRFENKVVRDIQVLCYIRE